MIVRLGALLGLWPAVWTRDHDGEVRLRRARFSGRGWCGWWCYGYGGSPVGRRIELRENHTGSSYVVEWLEWSRNRKHIEFKATPAGGTQA